MAEQQLMEASAPEPDAVILMIERAARDPAIDLMKFERLLTMRERVEDREAKRAFDNAVSLAKSEIGPIFKNREVDFSSQKGRTHYRYEDFAEVARVVDPVLGRHGLSYRHRAAQTDAKLSVTCILSHRDGYAEETTLQGDVDLSGNKNSIQAIGSSATYLQRYTLKLALGLSASDRDDDGRSAGDVAGDDEKIGLEEIMLIEQQLRDTDSDQAKFLDTLGAESLAAMTVKQFRRGKALLAEKKRRANARPPKHD